MRPDLRLYNRRILIVEDDYLQAFALRNELTDRGAEVIGPLGSLDLALQQTKLEQHIDAAVVDVSLGGEPAFSLVDELVQRDIPLMFSTGCGADVLPYRHQHIHRCEKPMSAHSLAEALRDLLADPAGTSQS